MNWGLCAAISVAALALTVGAISWTASHDPVYQRTGEGWLYVRTYSALVVALAIEASAIGLSTLGMLWTAITAATAQV